MSRWENAPTTRELAKLMAAMIGIYCASLSVVRTFGTTRGVD
jgi:hypothetical protein